MWKVPTNEDTPRPPHRKSHEVPHDHGISPRDEESAIGTAHHATHGHYPVPLPANDDSASTLHGDLTEGGEKGLGPQGPKGSEGGKRSDGEQGETTLEDSSELDENSNYPEGGLQAWLVVFGSFCLLVASLGILNSIGTFQAYLAENELKDYSEGTTGWIFGTHAFLAFFCGLQIGPIFDKRGPRALVLAGSIGLVLTLFLMSVCKEYWQYFLVFGVLGGISVSLLFTPAVASVGHWFMVKRATATGLAITGGSIGGIIFPLVLQKLIPTVGFPWACRVVGFIQLALLAVANFFVRSRLKPLPDAKASIDLGALRDPTFALTTFGVFLIEWGLFVPIAYLTSYSIHAGIETAFAYQLLAIFNAGSVFGRWLPNYLADKFGRFNVMTITSLFCVIIIIGLWLPSDDDGLGFGQKKAMLIAFSVLYGFGSGSGIGLTPVCVGQICRTEDYGKRYGTCYSLASFASLTGVPIAGVIYSKYGSYTGLIWFDAASYIGATIMFAAARVTGSGWGLKTIF